MEASVFPSMEEEVVEGVEGVLVVSVRRRRRACEAREDFRAVARTTDSDDNDNRPFGILPSVTESGSSTDFHGSGM